MLNQNKLNQYYKMVDTPGMKVEHQDFGNKYAFLDNDEIKEKLLDFSEGEISKVTLYIPSIHCASCIWLLENLQTLDKGVKHSLVNFVKKEVSITFNHQEINIAAPCRIAGIHPLHSTNQSESA